MTHDDALKLIDRHKKQVAEIPPVPHRTALQDPPLHGTPLQRFLKDATAGLVGGVLFVVLVIRPIWLGI